MEDSDSDQEVYPVQFQTIRELFSYRDPLSQSEILRATAENNIDRLKQLISQGKSVNISDNLGNTALHTAVLKKLPDIADYLLTLEEIIIDKQNFQGSTPLWYAAKAGHTYLTKRLIERGADVNLATLELVTPLHTSVRHPEVVKLLIENGANINALDYTEETPLHDAISGGFFETTCMLLYYNADANIPAENGLTPFMRAIIKDDLLIQELLLEYVTDFNGVTDEGMTVLKLALTHNCPYVEEIIRRGIDVHHQPGFYSVYITCLRMPNLDKFETVWKYYTYQDNDVMDFFALMLLHLDDNYYIYHYVRIIIESENVEAFFKILRLEPFLNFSRNILSLFPDVLLLVPKIVCLYLTYGYKLTGKAIGLIYKIFGRKDLLDICLHMDIDMKEHDDTFGVARALYDTSLSIEQIKLKFAENFELATPDSLLQILPYFKISKKRIFYNHLHTMQREFEFVCDLPSLLELARNKTRDYLIAKYKLYSAKEYYFFLKDLEMPEAYKDILTFHMPIYKL
ncbi:uncharacterized protein LOC143190088 [Rhynchophorus ferrugineus]|uniref:Uncharacterized protein n=1 Tax=Rhynchophorus ferrugineus TaxID=354439 RepID=A0A834I120_RHYFE|nr:hypothetical protein GWI33_018016 [Rhynchophorus ferrugineus]